MLLASPFSYICSAAATTLSAAFTAPCTPPYPALSLLRHLSSSSTFASSSIPRALAATAPGGSSQHGRATKFRVASNSWRGGVSSGRRVLFSTSSAAGESSGSAAPCSAIAASTMVPEDAATLLRAVYAAKPTPQLCVTTTGSGGQAISWLLGVSGASACLLEATVPYALKACDEKMAAGPSAPGYCSREAAEGLARDAYARAVSLSVAGSPDLGLHVLPERRVVGVGCTAAVVSSRPRRGLHHCFVCAQTAEGLVHYELNLAKGRRDRFGEDNAVSRVLLQAIAEAAKVPVPRGFMTDHLLPSDAPTAPCEQAPASGGAEGGKKTGMAAAAAVSTASPTEVAPAAELAPEPDALEELAAGRCSAVLIVPRDTRQAAAAEAAQREGGGAAAGTAGVGSAGVEAIVLREGALVRAALPKGRTVVLPGSYNPLHRGHLGLLEAARAALETNIRETSSKSRPPEASTTATASSGVGGVGSSGATTVHGVFEISVSNVDKGGLAAEEVRRRTAQFAEPGGVGWPYPVVVTRAPLFSQKARLFPGCAFVVGADTAKRIIDPRYYGNSQVEMVSALAEIRHLGCSFIVGGREDAGGRFLTLATVLEESGLPESLRSMFLGLDESAFREDLSSTSIREGKARSGL
ncbi:unnamed protein product [Scytosiphon promiscuus]